VAALDFRKDLLKARRYRKAMAKLAESRDDIREMRADLNGIAQHLDAIISLHDVRRYKPHPDAYHFLAQYCQTRRDNCWLVSRHSWDVLGAIHAGLHGIWVRPDGTPNEPWEFAPDVSLPDFPTLVDYARINIR
jgi:FMN phosphatase YigB (HAD superfamily)